MIGACRIIGGSGAALGLVLHLAASVRDGGPFERSSILELRQYTLKPGQRDVLIELFEQEFVESQESLGMRILGTFRDMDKPERFVWLRGFSDMSARGPALKAFYEGAVWQAHRHAANATMIDSDNVLLLHVARPASGLAPVERGRAPKGSSRIPPGLVVVNIYYFDADIPATFVADFDETARPALAAAAIPVNGTYVSETSPNNFPRLPVRERDRVFVWISIFADAADYGRALDRLAHSKEWQAASARIRERLNAEPEVLRLQPTARSALHY